MQDNGLRSDQVMQVGGFADQRLHRPEAPLDPSNRRISLIVQNIVKNSDQKDAQSPSTELEHPSATPSTPEKSSHKE